LVGAAILLQRGNYRQQFADFLDRLALGTAHADEWSSFVITHYHPDEFLEEMRRCTVRLGGGHLRPVMNIDSAEGRQVLRAWSIAIRSAVLEDAESSAAADPAT
jgi:hypothetical protein